MLNKIRPISSSDGQKIFLRVPLKWEELTQKQLRYVFTLLLLFPPEEVKAYYIIRMGGLTIGKRSTKGWIVSIRERWWKPRKWLSVSTDSIAELLHQCDWLESYDNLNTRLVSVGGCHAVDTDLHGVSFEDYLNIEGLYQIYLRTKDDKFLQQMAVYLYRDNHGKKALGIKCSEVERFGCFIWWNYVKSNFARCFQNFFKTVNTSVDGDDQIDVMGAVNAQIRALTDGDITKEEVVLKKDCWRASTELDAKAKEAEDFKKKYGK